MAVDLNINPSQGFTPIPNIPNRAIGFQPFSPNTNPASRPSNARFNFAPSIDMGGNVPGQPGLTIPGMDNINPDFFDPTGGSRFLVPGLEAFTGLGSLYLGSKALGLGEEQFAFSKAQSNRDFAAQADVFNTNLANAQQRRLQSSGAFDTSTPEGQAQFDAALDAYVAENRIQDVTL